MLSKRTIKKISIIIGTIFIVVWFGGNLGLYFLSKYYISSEPGIDKTMDYTPEKLKLVESDMKADYLYFMGFKIKFPFYKKDIKYVTPHFFEGKLWSISIFFVQKGRAKGFINFHDFEVEKKLEKPFLNRIWEKIFYKEVAFHEGVRDIEYARLKDFSWWNLFHNIRLSNLLILKALNATESEQKAYDLETPYFKGILKDFKFKPGRFMYACYFGWDDESYSLEAMGSDKEKNTVKDIISTIQRTDNREARYKEMEVLYNNKEKSRYPEELLLLSMISLKGVHEDNLKELLKIMEGKHYNPAFTESLKEAIEYQKKQR
jgi:hypothetical protein